MKDFKFHNPVTAVFGNQCMDRLADEVRGRRVLLVSGRSSAKENGTYDKVSSVLRAEAESFCDYDGVAVCTYDGIVKGCDAALSGNCDCIVGLGGAACMDTAKAVSFCALHRDDMDRYLKHDLPQRNDEKLRLVLIPTYPSTGSEANGVSDIMGYAGGISGVYADAALLYPPFTYSLGREATTYSLMVMMAQTGYRFFTDENPISRGFTAASLRAILGAHAVLVSDPRNWDARGTMLWASFVETSSMLGLGIEDRWPYSIFSANGLCRFTVGTSYREGLSVMLPRWLVWAYSHHPEQVRSFVVEVLGGDPDATDSQLQRFAFGKLMGILQAGGIPASLGAYGEEPSEEAIRAAIAKVSSREFTDDEYVCMVRDCYSEDFPSVALQGD